MEITPRYSTGNSSQKRGSFSWTNNSSAQMLAQSSRRREDDEEALKWAAIQKLPTYDRLRKGLLKSLADRATEINVDDLGFRERRNLIDRLLNVAEEDNQKFLLKLRDSIDRVGIKVPTIEVRFEHLTVEAQAHVGSKALPTLFNYFANMLEGVLDFFHVLPNRKKHLTVLKNVSGIIKPSRMTLLLGPPGSGKTTLLLALAGKLDTSLKFSGRVTYNGHGLDEFIPQRTAVYISQHDIHIAEMTVRETLAFSARCQGVGTRYDMLAELLRREKRANINPDPDIDVFMKAAATEGQEAHVMTDYVLKILGLETCADTFVGDEMLRGVSGGQKRRVTTGEMIVGPASAMFMDEISTGLDSSTTYQIVNSLKQYVQILEGTAFISLLQPAPETFDLFDDIVLLSDGLVVYQGPRDQVLEFFEFMGFKCPERKGVADFLQEVTSRKDQMQYWAKNNELYRFLTASEFSEAFKSFHVGRKIIGELASPFDKAKSHPAALTKNEYGVNKKELFKACFSREFLLMKRNSFVYIFKSCQLIVLTVITMTLFLRTEMARGSVIDGGIYFGALFFILIIVMLNGMAEVPATVAKLPVFYKQRDLRFYPASAYALPTWILKIPITFIEVTILTFISYYVIGFDPNVGRLLKQYLLLILLNQTASGFFRCVAAVGRNMILAKTIGWSVLLLYFLLGGFVLSRDHLKKWWAWGYWLSPMMYGQNALVVNEFLGHSWSHVLANSTERLGVEILKSRGFFTEAYWYWIGVVATLGFILLYNIFYIVALTFLNGLKRCRS